MQPPPPASPTTPAVKPKPGGGGMRRFVLVLVLLVAAFLAGYIPQWLDARRLDDELRTTTIDLRLANLHRQLGVASHEAQRNNFASAAAAAQQFFNGCGDLARTYEFPNEPRTKVALSAYAGSRDEIMGQLALGDPAVKERLATLYLTMNGVLERRQ